MYRRASNAIIPSEAAGGRRRQFQLQKIGVCAALDLKYVHQAEANKGKCLGSATRETLDSAVVPNGDSSAAAACTPPQMRIIAQGKLIIISPAIYSPLLLCGSPLI